MALLNLEGMTSVTSRLEVRYHDMKGKQITQQTIRHYIYYLVTRLVARPIYTSVGGYLGGSTEFDSQQELQFAAVVVGIASAFFIIFNLLYFDEFKVVKKE